MTVPRVLAHLFLAVLGLLVGTAAVLVQGGWFPGGLLLSLAASAGLFWGGALLTRSRSGAVAAAAAWAVAVLSLVFFPPTEGDFLMAAGTGSDIFLLVGMLAAVICATLAPPGKPRSGGLGDPAGRPE